MWDEISRMEDYSTHFMALRDGVNVYSDIADSLTKNLLHTLTRCVNAWAHDRRKYFLRIVHIQMNIVSAHLVNRSGVSIEISSKSVFKNNNIKARISIMHCVHVISCSNANTKKHKHFFFIWIVYHSFSFSLPVYLSSTVIAKCISHCETVNL